MVLYIASRYSAQTKEQFSKQLRVTKEISREVVLAGYEVITPHLYYPRFLDDDCEKERLLGTHSAIKLLDVCDALYVYIGLGVSKGMEAEIKAAKEKDMKIRYFRNMNELRDLLKIETSQDRATNAKVPYREIKSKLLKNINNIIVCTSTKYLDEVIENKNNIVDLFGEALKEQDKLKCEDCLHYPKKGKSFREECGTCSLFYASGWEER